MPQKRELNGNRSKMEAYLFVEKIIRCLEFKTFGLGFNVFPLPRTSSAAIQIQGLQP